MYLSIFVRCTLLLANISVLDSLYVWKWHATFGSAIAYNVISVHMFNTLAPLDLLSGSCLTAWPCCLNCVYEINCSFHIQSNDLCLACYAIQLLTWSFVINVFLAEVFMVVLEESCRKKTRFCYTVVSLHCTRSSLVIAFPFEREKAGFNATVSRLTAAK